MRIVYLHQYFRTPQQIGGTRSWEFSRRLAANGHEVHVVTSDTERPDAGRQWRVTDEDGVTVHWTSVQYSNSMGLRRRARAFAAFARRAAARAAVLPQDLVFATSTPLTIAIPGAYAARRNGVPMVFEVRDLWPELPIALGGLRSRPLKSAAWRLEAWAYRQSAHVIALSPGMAANIERRFPSKPITIIPNACDVEFFAGTEDSGKELRGRLPWLGDRQLILYAGTIGKANHTVYLPRVARALRAIGSDTQIVVLGSGGQAPQLRSEAADLGVLDQNFHIIDAVAKAEVPAWLAACDVSISTLGSDPALRSSSPNKVFDAFAAGRPLAINYDGWLADVLRRTKAGLPLPPDQPEAAAKQLAAFLDDPERISQARAAARELATNDFNRDNLYLKFEQVLLSAVQT